MRRLLQIARNRFFRSSGMFTTLSVAMDGSYPEGRLRSNWQGNLRLCEDRSIPLIGTVVEWRVSIRLHFQAFAVQVADLRHELPRLLELREHSGPILAPSILWC
jgi:hypothetical protein